MAEEENGTEFNPYGGKLHFDRDSPTGHVRVAVEFVNSSNDQSLSLTHQPIEPTFTEPLDRNVSKHQELMPPKS
jgi:hypothetical protein